MRQLKLVAIAVNRIRKQPLLSIRALLIAAAIFSVSFVSLLYPRNKRRILSTKVVAINERVQRVDIRVQLLKHEVKSWLYPNVRITVHKLASYTKQYVVPKRKSLDLLPIVHAVKDLPADAFEQGRWVETSMHVWVLLLERTVLALLGSFLIDRLLLRREGVTAA